MSKVSYICSLKGKKMKRRLIVLRSLHVVAAFLCVTASAQNISPKAYYTNSKQEEVETNAADEQAPLTVEFRANPTGLDDYTPSYEWHFRRETATKSYEELFVRYEEDTRYTFMESGKYSIKLIASYSGGDDLMDSVSVVISESKLEFPNAFSPNGDDINDIYRAKQDYQSIISFRAIILNRWGQKLYEWNDPSGGWDGTFHGKDVPDGVYFVLVKAKGADGKDYNIKKDVNLLRGYIQTNSSTGK